MASSNTQRPFCARCLFFNVPNPQRVYGSATEPECVIHGSQTYPPRAPSEEDLRSLRERVKFEEFDYREEDWDYDLAEEAADAFEEEFVNVAKMK